MILRSVMRHVQDQNWFAVALDFFIVVVGVFIGIQVANWNDEMSNQRLGADYEDRLITDLGKDLEMLRGLDSYYNAVLDSVFKVDRLLEQPSPDPEALLIAAYRATEINYSPQTRSTWDQIVSSGHIGLLPQNATAQLAEYFAFDFVRDSYDDLGESTYRSRVRSLIPITVQHAIQAGCSDVRTETAVIVGFMQDCELGLDSMVVSKVADRLFEDVLIRDALSVHYSSVSSAAINTQGLVVLVQNALNALDGSRAEDSQWDD